MMEIFIILGLILFNGLLSMSEIALVSARKSRLEAEAQKGNVAAKKALQLSREPDKFLSTVQIGITLIGILTGLFSGQKIANDLAEVIAQIKPFTPYATAISKVCIVILVTYLTLVLGELVPKRIGMAQAEKVAKLIATPMRWLSILCLPIVWLLSKSTHFLLKLSGIRKDPEDKVTEEEIKAIIKEGVHSGEVQAVEQDIMERVFTLGDRTVGSVMTHRSEIVWLDIHDSIAVVREKINEHLFNVYPVTSGKPDTLQGVVFLKDLFGKSWNSDFKWEEFVRPTNYFHENQNVYKALEQMKAKRVSYGIVMDEYGTVQGIITLKDILEALIGEVPAPDEEPEIIVRNDGSWLIDGQYSFYNFLEYFHKETLAVGNEFHTLSGLLLEQLGHIPVTGEKVSWEDFDFEIVDMDGARIDKILVSRNRSGSSVR